MKQNCLAWINSINVKNEIQVSNQIKHVFETGHIMPFTFENHTFYKPKLA